MHFWIVTMLVIMAADSLVAETTRRTSPPRTTRPRTTQATPASTIPPRTTPARTALPRSMPPKTTPARTTQPRTTLFRTTPRTTPLITTPRTTPPSTTRSAKRRLPLCSSCPAVALPNEKCPTTWAPDFGRVDGEGDQECVCLQNYVCCPKPCPKAPKDACPANTTGNFFTLAGADCCDCPTATCLPCPPLQSPKSLSCDQCYHYESHHTHQIATQCWESGCKKNSPIKYPEPSCDTKCRKMSPKTDDCNNPRNICVAKPMPVGCQPAKPEEKQCFRAPKKVFDDRFYSSNGVCKRCWTWVLEEKPEGCSQEFPKSEFCPAGHKRVTGVTTCKTPREICMPCQEVKASCSECEEMGTVLDGCEISVDTCVMKKCPSISEWTGKGCGRLTISKDSCGCETIQCDFAERHLVNRFKTITSTPTWNYDVSNPDQIQFKVNRKITVVGLGLFGGGGSFTYSVGMKIYETASSSSVSLTTTSFRSDGTNTAFQVMFDEPVEIQPNTVYTIVCHVNQNPKSRAYSGRTGQKEVVVNIGNQGPYIFTYSDSPGSAYTGVTMGQIPVIIFHA